MKRVLGILLLSIVLLAGVASAWAWQQYQQFLQTPVWTDAKPLMVDLQRGQGYRQICAQLQALGAPGPDWAWKVLGRESGLAGRLQAGEYQISSGTLPQQLLEQFARGEVVQYRFTIIEGWNWRELRQALRADAVLVQTLDGMDEQRVAELLELPGGHPEGWFLPETYRFVRGSSDLDLLRRAHKAMQLALAEAWQSRQPDLPLADPYGLLTLASIIEKETGQADERSRISGVFVRRLRIGMRLQTDPTVIYGLGESFDGNLRRVHLDTDGPYNTYRRGGLPPTPIAMPGRAALMATGQPLDGTELYFVSRGDGSHQFSTTLAEHNAAVRRWQLGGRSRAPK